DRRRAGTHPRRGGARARRRVVARGELPLRRADLPARQPAPQGAAEGRARQAAAARPLGHHAGADAPVGAHEPGHQGPGPRRDLRHGPRARRAGHRGRGLPGRDVRRGLHGHHRGRGGAAPAVPPVLLPGRDPEPRRAGDAGLHPRGRGARLRARARLRRRLRRPRPGGLLRHRRRGGRDRAARGELALEQVRRPGARRCGAPRPAPQRLQDRQPHRARADAGGRAGRPPARLRPRAPRRRGRRPGAGPRAPGHDARPLHGRHRGDPPARPGGRRAHPPALAHDRPAHAEGLDGPAGGRRQARRGPLPLPPGPAVPARHAARAPEGARGVDALLPPGGALRRGRRGQARAARPRARRPPAHEREPAHERRRGPAGPAPARLPPVRPRRAGSGREHGLGHGDARAVAARRHPRQPGDLPAVRPGRDGVQPPAGGLRGHEPHVDGGDRRVRRQPRGRRAGHGGPQRAPLPGLAGGLPAHGPPRAVLLLRGVHPHRGLDGQPARQVAEDHPRDPVAPAAGVAELPPDLARLAPGPQRLLPPGPRLHRPRGQQEGGDRPRLPAAGRQLPALRGRPLPALAPLHQRDHLGQAARPPVPDDGRGDRALHARDRHLGLGEHGPGPGAGRRPGLRGRHPDARGGRRGGDPARAPARAAGALRERRRPDAPAGRPRAPARPAPRRVRRAVHRGQADRLRLPRLSPAHPRADLPAHEPRQPPRARLQRGGHDHDALRHGHAQRPGPLPARHGRHRPGAGAHRAGGAPAPGDGGRAALRAHPHAPHGRRPGRPARLRVAGRAGGSRRARAPGV
ncbi:MAG: Xylulose-5-phosphate phosphoketolase @ Fructose-6-phosphate phosphoketolase, partial [uncultured Solirubrobacteraceae bacterium]